VPGALVAATAVPTSATSGAAAAATAAGGAAAPTTMSKDVAVFVAANSSCGPSGRPHSRARACSARQCAAASATTAPTANVRGEA